MRAEICGLLYFRIWVVTRRPSSHLAARVFFYFNGCLISGSLIKKEFEKPMKWQGVNELREKYLSFFESKGHTRLPSFSLVPQGDKSLLLINSGMAPLKKYFLGQAVPPNTRVTTCQKCIRTPDIERVGQTARHGTYFEMLGNFSFGDYFKIEAITWAWEFFTKVLEMPADKLYVSVFENDDEAYGMWTKQIGVAEDHMVRLGREDNFWEHGSGPCGPCSEIYFDRGPEKGCGKPDCHVGCDCDRYVEVWNLVFSQFDSDGNGLSVMDVVASEDDMADKIGSEEICGSLRGYMEKELTPREAAIITLRYGLNGMKPKTQRETAELCGISRSYVSRIEKRALEKLREALGEEANPG